MKRSFDKRNKTLSDEVFVHFKTRLGTGQSQFTVNVPVIFSDRQFFFSSLVLLPDFYSLEALVEGIDDPDVYNTLIHYELQFKTNFLDKPNFYPDEYVLPATVTTVMELVKSVNEFFEAHKPTVASRLGFFLDWTDARFEEETNQWDEWMKTNALTYYNEPLNPEVHFNALPASARTVEGVNNYLFPTHLNDYDRSFIRFRIFLVPNANVFFSTDTQLQALGFSPNQIGELVTRKKYMWSNESNANFKIFEAEYEFTTRVSKTPAFKISLDTLNKNYLTEPVVVSIKKGDTLKNENYIEMMKKALDTFSYDSNLQLNIAYNKGEKTFTFGIPQDRAISRASLILPSELALRLGFNLVTEISFKNKKGEPVSDTIDVKQTEAKARALGYDTGVVLVSDANSSANTAAGISEKFMCSLYPTPTGTFEIPVIESCFKPPVTTLPNFYDMNNNTVPAHFTLSRYLDDGSLVKLDWRNTAFVSGLLRGHATVQSYI